MKHNRRRGNLFLLLLIGISIMALGASRLVPNYVTVKQRQSEQQLKFAVGQIRSGIDLERKCGSISPCATEYASLTLDPQNRNYLASYVQALVKYRFLPAEHRNPLVPEFNWGTSSGKLYWEVQENVLASRSTEGVTSFEASGTFLSDGSFKPTGWKNGLMPSTHASATLYNDSPSMQSNAHDDYHNQNKMGKVMTATGSCLRIATGTP